MVVHQHVSERRENVQPAPSTNNWQMTMRNPRINAVLQFQKWIKIIIFKIEYHKYKNKIQDGDSIKNTDIKIQLIVVSERMSNLNKEKKIVE
jgi:hypothetical protein